MKNKVAILNDVINNPYNSLFIELSKSKNYDFKVFYCFSDIAKIIKNMDYKYEILSKWQLPFKTELQLAFNPTIIFRIAAYNPEIIIIMGWDLLSYWLAFIYAKIFGKKILIWSGSTMSEISVQRSLTLPLVKFLTQKADACLVYGTKASQYLSSLGVKNDRIFIAFNTVDINFFIKSANILKNKKEFLKKKYEVNKKKVILFIGQLIDRKGILDLVKSINILKSLHPNILLVIAGQGEIKNKLMNYINKKNIENNVKFLGKVDYDLLPEIFSIADLFVLPSKEEVWGLVVNEAMASGLPVIVSDRVGSREDLISPGENGLIFPSGNYSVLAEKIHQIIKNSVVRDKMGVKSGKIIKKYSNKNRAYQFFKAITYSLKND